MFLKSEFSNRLVQVSLFSAIVYYITAYPVVFEKARKYFPVKFKKTHHLLLFHTFVFAVLMYVLTYFVFDPLVRVVEGADDEDSSMTKGEGDKLEGCENVGEYPKVVNDVDQWDTFICNRKKYQCVIEGATRVEWSLRNYEKDGTTMTDATCVQKPNDP